MTDFDRFLVPIEGDAPCGPDLEYDNEFLAMTQAVAGKPEQQFGDTVIPAGDPDWREVERLTGALMARTRDLRVVASYTLATTHLHGIANFAGGLKLALALCEQFWDDVHPRIEVDGDNDPYLRMNAIAAFSAAEFSTENRLIAALRQCALIKAPLALTFRDIELAFAKTSEATYELAQIAPVLTDALLANSAELLAVDDALKTYQALRSLVEDRVSIAEAPDMERLTDVLKPVVRGLDALRAAASGDAEVALSADGGVVANGSVGLAGMAMGGAVQSRDDAHRALERVCVYLEKNEPSNPAGLFVRRAQRMLHMPFLEIMREMSPDSMSHLEMLTGAKARDEN